MRAILSAKESMNSFFARRVAPLYVAGCAACGARVGPRRPHRIVSEQSSRNRFDPQERRAQP
jgi:hypothetical protein